MYTSGLFQPEVRTRGKRGPTLLGWVRGSGLIKWQGHWNCRLAPESLDPRTLRLLWEQRELEIQALRWAIQNGQNARQCHILQEVAGIPPERSAMKPQPNPALVLP